MTKRIAIGADHAGFEEKEKIKATLDELGVEYVDMGTNSADSVDYPDYAKKVAEAVSKGEFEQGLLVCGSGTGMAIAANKVKVPISPGSRVSITTRMYFRFRRDSCLRTMPQVWSRHGSKPTSRADVTRNESRRSRILRSVESLSSLLSPMGLMGLMGLMGPICRIRLMLIEQTQ